MLPLIVIGATDRVREILEPYAEAGHISYHPTVEAAYHALSDELVRHSHDTAATMTPSGHWRVHVAYGPAAWGYLTRGQVGAAAVAPATLPVAGHKLIFGLDVHEPPPAIRAIGGEPETEPEHTMIWTAATVASVDLVADLENPNAIEHLINYLSWKS
jgi:hypothetical protein